MINIGQLKRVSRPEVKMKKHILLGLLMMFVLTLVLPAGLFTQEEDPEEGPVQALPDPKAWEQLPQMEMLKTLGIKETIKGQAWQFDMNNIKQALVKARVQEAVTIEYVSLKGMVYNLGTYSPMINGPLIKKPVGFVNPIKRKAINPQPEPPGFSTIPPLKQVALNTALPLKDARWNGKAVLLFKDASGQLKAAVELNLAAQTQIEPRLKEMNSHQQLH